MAKQIEGVYERILECAKKEFLEKGYTEASLRNIAVAAETSTNSIYVRFKDKEGLFEAIVKPIADEFMSKYCGVQEQFSHYDADKQKQQVNEYSARELGYMLDYIYDHFDEFHLLLDASYGTKFHNFVDELTRIEVKYTYKFMEAVGYERVQDGTITEDFLHIVTTSFMEGMFEVVRHNMSKEEAGKYIVLLGKYHRAGFSTFFQID
ncbi:MAG: TetR/AcrR family transcriptional regulator [Lachnospiraceae bacterium]|nr:TetR/AcrR family transcriptional regulator [Lachnospiraceae bacterium]